MKKILLFILLAILPLQTSWSVVGVYCVQEEPVCLENCDYTSQKISAYSLVAQDQVTQITETEIQSEHSCNSPSTAFILSAPQAIPPAFTFFALRSHEVQLSLSAHAKRLERPNWSSPI